MSYISTEIEWILRINSSVQGINKDLGIPGADLGSFLRGGPTFKRAHSFFLHFGSHTSQRLYNIPHIDKERINQKTYKNWNQNLDSKR